jgi:hypothetical protein
VAGLSSCERLSHCNGDLLPLSGPALAVRILRMAFYALDGCQDNASRRA